MATHSSILAWRIPGTEEPGGGCVYGVAQGRTRLKRLSSGSSSRKILKLNCGDNCTNLLNLLNSIELYTQIE